MLITILTLSLKIFPTRWNGEMASKKIWVQVIFDGSDGDYENYDHGRHHAEFARLKNA